MRVYAESQYHAWEFEAIKSAILDGTLTYTPKLAQVAHEADTIAVCVDVTEPKSS